MNSRREKLISGTIFNIQRYSVHDGPGIRTTVFLKGCPLGCLWCHNPESQEFGKEISYYGNKCIQCGACAVCPNRCHTFEGTVHQFANRNRCTMCGLCVEVCYSQALTEIGRVISADELLEIVCRDAALYKISGGGLTLSGGEPFAQPAFALALLQGAKEEELHTCVETCGAVPWEVLESALPYTDLFLYDIKETDPVKHKQYTSADNTKILENLAALDAHGAQIILRCPIIPELNDTVEHFKGIGQIADRLANVLRVDVEPYHPLGISKAEAIGKTPLHTSGEIPAKEIADGWASAIRKYTTKDVFCV